MMGQPPNKSAFCKTSRVMAQKKHAGARAFEAGRLHCNSASLPGSFSSNRELRMKLTVYTAPWCRDCHVAKRWLAQNNISFDEINIEETPGAAEEVIQRTGKRAIPQFVINGAWVQPYIPGEGFKYREMAELFGVNE
jgi:mycoredoxin